VFTSANGGTNWSASNTGLTATTDIRALAIDPVTPTTLYAGTPGSGVFRTTNGGGNWTASNTGLTNTSVPGWRSNAEIVFDKFHVLQHASAALDDVRRQEFFRAGAVMREHGRGKRWLLLRRWKTVRGSKRAELQTLFAANRRLFKAYVLREQLDRLWIYKTRTGVLNFVNGWIDALRWQRLPEMDRLGEFLFTHIEGIAAYCDHPVLTFARTRPR
jgi:hypothetical protein